MRKMDYCRYYKLLYGRYLVWIPVDGLTAMMAAYMIEMNIFFQLSPASKIVLSLNLLRYLPIFRLFDFISAMNGSAHDLIMRHVFCSSR